MSITLVTVNLMDWPSLTKHLKYNHLTVFLSENNSLLTLGRVTMSVVAKTFTFENRFRYGRRGLTIMYGNF